MFAIIIGTKSGLTRLGPLPSSTSFSRSTREGPPPPVFMTTPIRSAVVSSTVMPASGHPCPSGRERRPGGVGREPDGRHGADSGHDNAGLPGHEPMVAKSGYEGSGGVRAAGMASTK